MGFLRKLVGVAVVFTGVALGGGLGPSEARADGCMQLFPDCEATMGLCGARCSSCWLIDYENWQDPYEWCADMCADYGGSVSVTGGNSGTWPDYYNVMCRCAEECPYYYE